MFSISPLQACSFRCWFSNNSVITFLEGCFPSSFVAEVGIFFSILISIIYLLLFHSGGIVMLLSSLIFSICEDRVLFVRIHFQPECRALFSSSSHSVKFCLPYQPECCLNLIFLVPCLSRCNQSGFNIFLSIVLVIHSLATSKVLMVFLVSIFYRSALNCVQLRCVLSFNFSTSQGSLLSLICRRSTLVLPPLLLFRFPPVPS